MNGEERHTQTETHAGIEAKKPLPRPFWQWPCQSANVSEHERLAHMTPQLSAGNLECFFFFGHQIAHSV